MAASGPRCAACSSPKRAKIDSKLSAGEPTRIVSRWLEEQGESIHHSSLVRHKRNHIKPDPIRDAIAAGPVSDANPRHVAFATAYLASGNATQAAIRAGYSPKSAHSTGYDLLRHPDVQAIVQSAKTVIASEVVKAEVMSAQEVLAELTKIGRSDIRKYIKAGMVAPETDEKDIVSVPFVSLIPSDEWSDAAAAAVVEISTTQSIGGTNVKVKLHKKLDALDSLAKYHQLYTDGPTVNVDVSVPSDPSRIRKEIEDLLAKRDEKHEPHTAGGDSSPPTAAS